MKTPYFSVVMPVYGVENYIVNTVDSVLKQTYENFELILVDDCSPDNSGKICDELALKDDRITVIHKDKNGGLSMARNTGAENVSGKYVFFMDSDDIIDSNLFKDVKTSIDKNKADVIVFGLVEDYYNKAGKLLNSVPVHFGKDMFITNKDELREQVIILEDKTLYGYAWNKFYSVAKLVASGVKFEKITLIEDILFNVKVFSDIDSLNILNTTPYHYMKRIDSSLTNQFLDNYFFLNKKRIELVLQQYNDWGKCTDEVKTVLANIYMRYMFSALQRNYDKRSGMTSVQRREWLIKEYESILCKELINYICPDDKLNKTMADAFIKKNIRKTMCISKIIFIVKNLFPGIFSVLKQKK